MATGKIATSVLTDIANAIRAQNGTGTLYYPGEMGDAVAALDGTSAGEAGEEEYKGLEEGLVAESVFSGVADALRAQTGGDLLYYPGEMAAAILALTWDLGTKLRALLLEDGTLELNYRDGRSSDLGLTVVEAWEVDTGGYSSDDDVPWNGSKGSILRVVFDDDFAEAGVTDISYWFLGHKALTEVVGFQNVVGLVRADQTFNTCSALETIWATDFDSSAMESARLAFSICYRLVGGTGYVPETSTSSTAPIDYFCLGDEGVLTDPDADSREWLWGHAYEDGELVLTGSEDPEDGRDVAATGRVCATARYISAGGLPWYDVRTSLTSVVVAEDAGGCAVTNLDYWFYGLTTLTSVEGLGNLTGVGEMRYAFANCDALEELDLRGMDPSGLGALNYAFSSCDALTTIWADSDWELPSTASGSGTFYSCSSLVGGNGTTYSSSRISYRYMVIDSDDATGYLTAG